MERPGSFRPCYGEALKIISLTCQAQQKARGIGFS